MGAATVVRVDEVGRPEAVAYEAMEAQADPLDPTTGCFSCTASSSTTTRGGGARSASTGSGLSDS